MQAPMSMDLVLTFDRQTLFESAVLAAGCILSIESEGEAVTASRLVSKAEAIMWNNSGSLSVKC